MDKCSLTLKLFVLLIAPLGLVYCDHCDTGYCLPDPEIFLNDVVGHHARTVAVSSICVNSSEYIKFPDTGDPTLYQCLTESVSSANIYDDGDPDFSTYWQSENAVSSLGSITEQWIEVNLTDVFAIRSVLIAFTSPHVSANELSDVRPKALVIERWLNVEQRYSPWQYYSANCLASFPDVPFQPINDPPQLPTTVVCKEVYYSGDTTTRTLGKPYQFVLYSPFADFRTSIIRDKAVQDYYSTSAIRIRLVEPSDQTPLASYYTVSNLQIEGSCICYGHADNCMGQNNAECECVHNTKGVNCDECLPLYSRVPWQMATDIVNASCLECQCNGNADSCVFNETIGEVVCLGCYGNSYGNQCQYCTEGYYSLTLEEDKVNCTECQCAGLGVVSTDSAVCNSTSGQCQCKQHVTGRTCDMCQNGFWNLTKGNINGCQACDHCNIAGTEASVCDKSTGKCLCKDNTMGDSCSTCKPHTFNLTDENLQGCTPCDCTPGASLNASCEHSPSGQCTCVDYIGGRSCDMPSDGFFIPKMDYLTFHVTPGTQVVLPATMNYTVVIRSASPSAGRISTSETISSSCLGKEQQLLSNLSTVCLVAGKVYDLEFINTVTLTLLPPMHELHEESTEAQDCLQQVMADVDHRSDYCIAIEYSTMAGVYGEALKCVCDVEGAMTPDLCDPYSGQCYCKTGITGQTCDRCLDNHYNRTEYGCVDCNCHPNGSDELMCNVETGTCSCHDNVVGDKCDRCLAEHYGLNSGTGCKPCMCSNYSVSKECHAESGQCLCYSGVTGSTCTHCQDGYHSLSSDGCQPCKCNMIGSVANTCSQVGGTCSCKPLVDGHHCDTCTSGFHRLWEYDKPCKMCYCSGHSFQCSTQPGWYKWTIGDRWSLIDGSVVAPRWSAIDNQRNEQVVSTEVYHMENDVLEVTKLTLGADASLLYYRATDKYLGDRKSSYYQNLMFSISYTYGGSRLTSPLHRYLIVRGQLLDYELWSYPIDPPNNALTEYRLRISEDNFIRNDTLRKATLPDMLILLNNLTEILIPANFDQEEGSVGRLYSVAVETGTREPMNDGVELSNVEVCQCPPGYEGEQCESCSFGYHREPLGSDSPQSECVPCNCNGEPCDLLTGECQCSDNTHGAHCDTCAPGFYGAPAEGVSCKECECYSMTNKSCRMEPDGLPTCVACDPGHSGRLCESCLSGYYGNPQMLNGEEGQCKPCQCNGHTDLCNQLTGVCTECENNTAGDHCEYCADGFYGNSAVGCQGCNCSATGYNTTCDLRTGACKCLDGLDILANCGSCLSGYYFSQHSCILFALSSDTDGAQCSPCLPCSCNTEGTVGGSNTCSSTTGQCPCVHGVGGADCSSCAHGYYGSSPLLCQECGCNPEGSKPNTSCDAVTGQCQCLHSAIHGRSCDQCLSNTHGEFPLCSLCGDCFDGWYQEISHLSIQLNNSIQQLKTLHAPYDGFTVEQVQHIISAIQQNISLSQELYKSAYTTLNMTERTKSIFILLHLSLDEISQAVNILANQNKVFSDQLNHISSRYLNSTEISLHSLPSHIKDTSSAGQKLYTQLLQQEERWNSTIANLTTYQHTHQVIMAAVTGAMEKINSTSVDFDDKESYFVFTLLRNLQNVSAQLLTHNATLHILDSALEGDSAYLNDVSEIVASLRNKFLSLREATLHYYKLAVSQQTGVSSLSASALATKQGVQHLLSAINIYMDQISSLQSKLDSQRERLGMADSSMLDISAVLERVKELSDNITSARSVPSLQQIESLLDSIKENWLEEVQVEIYTDKVEELYTVADEYMADVMQSEEEVSRNVELMQSAERDLVGAGLLVNKSKSMVDEEILSLQTTFNTAMFKTNTSLIDKSRVTTQIIDQLTLFRRLTNQVNECSANSTDELSSLNISTSAMEQLAAQNEQTLADLASNKAQMFQRLQMQTESVQRSQIMVDQAKTGQEELDHEITRRHQQLAKLLGEYRENQQRLETLERQIEAAESRLETVIDSYSDSAAAIHGDCQP